MNHALDKNHFEEIIDKMMIDSFPKEFKEKISSMSTEEKRMAILSLLDKDRNLFLSIKSLIKGSKVSKVDHLKDVILMLRKYVKVGEVEKKKFGEVMTDLDLVKHIISKIPKEAFTNKNTKFLDPANGTGVFPLVIIYKLMEGLADQITDEEERYKWIVENQIYVADIQPKNMFLFMCLADPYDEYELNIFTGNSLDKGFDQHMKEVWGLDKFDYCIGNPPFNQMVDLKFIQKFYHVSDVILFVHPSTWLLDEKGKQKQFLKTKNLVKDHLESIELFNGNGVFGISLFVPCSITYINKYKEDQGIKCLDRISSSDLTYSDINQINKFSSISIYPELKAKFISISELDNLQNHVGQVGNYYINIPQIRGDVKNRDKFGVGMDQEMVAPSFTSIISSKFEVERSPRQISFGFNSLLEANNFLSYIKSKFARFAIQIFKNNQNQHRGELMSVPWLDFSQEWVDVNLYEEFNLTPEEIGFINDHIPKYYDIITFDDRIEITTLSGDIISDIECHIKKYPLYEVDEGSYSLDLILPDNRYEELLSYGVGICNHVDEYGEKSHIIHRSNFTYKDNIRFVKNLCKPENVDLEYSDSISMDLTNKKRGILKIKYMANGLYVDEDKYLKKEMVRDINIDSILK